MALACGLSAALWPAAANAASATILINEVEADTPGAEPATEWVELKNVSAAAIALTNWTLTDNTQSDTIPSLTLGAGETIVIASDSAAFFSAHPTITGGCVISIGGSIGGGLANTGDRVILADGGGTLVDGMSYGTDTTSLNPPLPAGAANTTETHQRISAIDTDTDADWSFAPETPGDSCGPPNQPPSLQAIGDRNVAEGAHLTFTLSATDADGDPVSYSATNLPAGASFGAGTFSWTPGFDQAGSYPGVRFEARDGRGGTDSEDITITVADVNRAPVLAGVGNRDTAEGQGLQVALSASDPDGDPLTYLASNVPAGAVFSAGGLSWTPGFDQAGTYPSVHFEVSDGRGGTDSEDITLAVTDTNRPPMLGVVGNKAADEGRRLTFTLSASDPDGDAVTFSALGLPEGASFSGATFAWTPGFGQAGTHGGVQLRADDGRGGTDSENIAIEVGNVLRAATATLVVWKVRGKLRPAGSVRAGTPGVQVKVVLLRRRDGRFRKLGTRRPRLDGRRRYATTFTRPHPGRCRITVTYPGDGETAKASSRDTFRC